MIAEALKELAVLQNSSYLPVIGHFCGCSENPVRLHRAPHYLLVGGVGISSFQSNAYMAITMSISYSMASLFLAHKYCNPFPIFKLFSSIPRTRPPHIPPRVEPDHFSTRASSFQRTTAGQSCVSPSQWQMKRRSPLRSITIPQTVKVMPSSGKTSPASEH